MAVPTQLAPERTSALNDPEQHGDDRHHEEEVDEAAEGVGRTDSKQPEYDEDNDEG
jgi:hypothetical protein